jgi:hypothetical protein
MRAVVMLWMGHYSLSHESRYRVQVFLFHVHLVWLLLKGPVKQSTSTLQFVLN